MAEITSSDIISDGQNRIPVLAESQLITFGVSQMPPNIRIYTYVNNVNITKFTGPASQSSAIGDPITTDQLGNATGYLIIPSEKDYNFNIGELTLTFGDSPDGIDTCKYISESVFMNHGFNQVDTEQGGTIALRAMEKIRTSTQGSSVSVNTTQARLDPLSQTFIIDGTRYPLGLYVTGVNLFFYAKDDKLPVAIELRPMVNGKPSTTEYFSGSYVIASPSSIEVYNPTTGDAPGIGFTFIHPIYLKPGEYAFCVTTKSDKYALLSAKQGDGKTVKQPFSGLLFKPQNTGDWVGDSNEDLTFQIRKAKFKTGTSTFYMNTPALEYIDEYSTLRLLSTEINFGNTAKVEYKIQTTQAGTNSKSQYTSVSAGGFAKIDSRQIANKEGDVQLEVTMTTKSEDVSPMLDRQLVNAQVFNSLVEPYSQSISDSELKSTDGTAKSRYISKIVSLQEGFDSTGLEVKVDVNRKTGTDIEVYGRVLSRSDNAFTSGIRNKSWMKLPLYLPKEKSYAGISDVQYTQETYRLLEPALTYTNLANVASNIAVTATYTDFAQYQVKVVFYSNNPTYLPRIKNLTATSVL
jgi:hypothetical protein